MRRIHSYVVGLNRETKCARAWSVTRLTCAWGEKLVWKCMAVFDVCKDLCLISAEGLVYSYSNAYVCSRYVTPFHFTLAGTGHSTD